MAKVKLERILALAEQRISKQLAEDFAIAADVTIYEHFWDQVVFQIRQHVMGRTMEEIEVRYPADWWQAFKQRWYPGWARARWPVRETVTRLVARELYPKIAMPDEPWYISLEKELGGCGD